MLARWGVDIRRTAEHAVEALAQARAEPLTDAGVDAYEKTMFIAGALYRDRGNVRHDSSPNLRWAQRLAPSDTAPDLFEAARPLTFAPSFAPRP